MFNDLRAAKVVVVVVAVALAGWAVAVGVGGASKAQAHSAAAEPAAIGPAATQGAGVPVEIDNFVFKPAQVVIKVGETVVWTNHDDVPHTATGKGDVPAFDSKTMDTDGTFRFTFSQAGVYPYYCKVHPHMTGTVVVK